jgi:uncharacterized protein YdcH (DUF465 family)
MDERALKELLTRDNPEFRKAVQDHQDCEREIEAIRHKTHPTEDDSLAERELKKRKLALKDRMYQIMLDYQRKA